MKLNRRSREILTAITDELALCGVTAWQLEQRRKHPAVTFEVNGQPRMLVFSHTTGDRACAHNLRRDARRLAGG